MTSYLERNVFDDMEKAIDGMFKAKAKYSIEDGFLKMTPFQCRSKAVRDSLRVLEEKGLLPADERAWRSIVELANSIEPFLRNGDAEDDILGTGLSASEYVASHSQIGLGLGRVGRPRSSSQPPKSQVQLFASGGGGRGSSPGSSIGGHSQSGRAMSETRLGRSRPHSSAAAATAIGGNDEMAHTKQGTIHISFTAMEQSRIRTAFQKAVSHIARLEESVLHPPKPQSLPAAPQAPDAEYLQIENEKHMKHIDSLERQLDHLRAEREKLVETNRAVISRQSKENNTIRKKLAEALKDVEEAKKIFVEKEAALETALAHLTITQDDLKRAKHEVKVKQHANKPNLQILHKAQTSLLLTHATATGGSGSSSPNRSTFGPSAGSPSKRSAAVSAEDYLRSSTGGGDDGRVSYLASSAFLGDEGENEDTGGGDDGAALGGGGDNCSPPSRLALNTSLLGNLAIGTSAGSGLDTIGNVDATEALSSSFITDQRRKSQDKFNLQNTVNLKATNDVYRQELHKERSERAREKATISAALDDALKRAKYSEGLIDDMQTQLMNEKERRESAEANIDEMSKRVLAMEVAVSKADARRKDAELESDRQQSRTASIETQLHEVMEESSYTEKSLRERIDDMSKLLHDQRMSQVEVQAELSRQSAVSLENAQKLGVEQDLLYQKIENLTYENVDLADDLNKKEGLLRSSGHLITDLSKQVSQANLVVSNPPSPLRSLRSVTPTKSASFSASKSSFFGRSDGANDTGFPIGNAAEVEEAEEDDVHRALEQQQQYDDNYDGEDVGEEEVGDFQEEDPEYNLNDDAEDGSHLRSATADRSSRSSSGRSPRSPRAAGSRSSGGSPSQSSQRRYQTVDADQYSLGVESELTGPSNLRSPRVSNATSRVVAAAAAGGHPSESVGGGTRGGGGYQGDGGSIVEFEFEELRVKVEHAEAELQSLESKLRSEFEEEKQTMQATFYAQLHADTEETSAQLSTMERRLYLLSEENSALRSQCKEHLDQLTVQEEQLQQSERDQENNEMEIRSLRSTLEEVAGAGAGTGSSYPSLTENALAKISPRSSSKSRRQEDGDDGKNSVHSSPSSLSTLSQQQQQDPRSQAKAQAQAHALAFSQILSPHPESTTAASAAGGGGGGKGFFKEDLHIHIETEDPELDPEILDIIADSAGATPLTTPMSKKLSSYHADGSVNGDIASIASKQVSTAETAAKRLDRSVKKMRSVSSSIVRAAERSSQKEGGSVTSDHSGTASMTISRHSMLKVADTLESHTQTIEDNTAQILEQVHDLRQQLVKTRREQEEASVYSAALSERERELSQDLTRARLQAIETKSQLQELSAELQKEREEKETILKSKHSVATAAAAAAAATSSSTSASALITYPSSNDNNRQGTIVSAPSYGGSLVDPGEYQRQIDALQQKLRTMQARDSHASVGTGMSPLKSAIGDDGEIQKHYERELQDMKVRYEDEIAALNEQMAEYISLLKESLAEGGGTSRGGDHPASPLVVPRHRHGAHTGVHAGDTDEDVLSISIASYDSPGASTIHKSSIHRLDSLLPQPPASSSSAQKTPPPLRSSHVASSSLPVQGASLESEALLQRQLEDLQKRLDCKESELQATKTELAILSGESRSAKSSRDEIIGRGDSDGDDDDDQDSGGGGGDRNRRSRSSRSRTQLVQPSTGHGTVGSSSSKRNSSALSSPRRKLSEAHAALSARGGEDEQEVLLAKLSEQEVRHKSEVEKLLRESRDQLLTAQSTFETNRVEMRAKYKSQIEEIKGKYKEEIKNLKKQLKSAAAAAQKATGAAGDDTDAQSVGSASFFTIGTGASSNLSALYGPGVVGIPAAGASGLYPYPTAAGGLYPHPTAAAGVMLPTSAGGSVSSHPDTGTIASLQQQFELQSQVMSLQHELKGEKGDRQRDLREVEQKYQRDLKDLEQLHQRDIRDLEQQRQREASDAKQEQLRVVKDVEQQYQGKVDKLKKKVSQYKAKLKSLEGDEYHSDGGDDDWDDRSVSSRRSRSADPRHHSSGGGGGGSRRGSSRRRRSGSRGAGDDESDAASTVVSTAMSTVVQDLDEAKNKIKHLKDEHDEHVRELKTSIKERDSMIKELQQAVMERDKSMFEHQVQKQDTLQEQHDKVVAKKDVEIERLEEKLKQSKEVLATAQLDLLALRSETKKNEPDPEQKEALVNQLQHLQIIKERQEREIGSLMEHNQRLEDHEEQLQKANEMLQQLRDHYEGELDKQRKYYQSQVSSIQEALADPKSPQRGGTPGGGMRSSISVSGINASNMSIAGASPNHQLLAENDELQKRVKRSEARSIALTQQLQSMPASLQVAVAERRVVEARLQKALVASDARLKAQIVVAETAKKELQAFLDIAALEKTKLTERIRQQAATIHQLTHHLHMIQSGASGTMNSNLSDISAAAAVSDFLDLDIPAAPWADKTMPAQHLNSSTLTGGKDRSAGILSDNDLANAAFAKTVSESFQPYQSAPFILPKQTPSSVPASPARRKANVSVSQSLPDGSLLRSPVARSLIPQSPLRASADDIRSLRLDDPYEPLRNSFYGGGGGGGGRDVRASASIASNDPHRYTDMRPAPIATHASSVSAAADAMRPDDEVKSESSYSQYNYSQQPASASARSRHAGTVADAYSIASADGGQADADAASHRSQRSQTTEASKRNNQQSTAYNIAAAGGGGSVASFQGSATTPHTAAGGGSVTSKQPFPAHLTPRPQSTTAATTQIYGNIPTTDQFRQSTAAAHAHARLNSSVASSAETVPMNFVSSPSSAASILGFASAGDERVPVKPATGSSVYVPAEGRDVRDGPSARDGPSVHSRQSHSEVPLPSIQRYSSRGVEEVLPEQAAFPPYTELDRGPSYASTISTNMGYMQNTRGDRGAGDGSLQSTPDTGNRTTVDTTPSTTHSYRSHHSQQSYQYGGGGTHGSQQQSRGGTTVRNLASESPLSVESSQGPPWIRNVGDPALSSPTYTAQQPGNVGGGGGGGGEVYGGSEGGAGEEGFAGGFVNDEIEAAMAVSISSGVAVSSLIDLQSGHHSAYAAGGVYGEEEAEDIADNESSVFRGIRSSSESSARMFTAGAGVGEVHAGDVGARATAYYQDPYDFSEHGEDSYGDYHYNN